MYRERAISEVEHRNTGLDSYSRAATAITGMNQGLELMRKGFDLAEKAASGFIKIVQTFAATGSQFEQWNVQFRVMLGSAEKASARVQELFDFSVRTPFRPEEVIEAGKALEAYGIYSERALTAAGDAAAAFGRDFGETILSLAAATTGELERLKVYGITSAALAAQMGHEVSRATQADLRDIGQAVIELFEKKAGGGMAQLSLTMGGMISTLQGKWTEFTRLVADAKVFETVRDIFSTILDSVNQLFDAGKAEQLASVIGATISTALLSATVVMGKAALYIYDLAKNVKAWLAEQDIGPDTIEGAKESLKGAGLGLAAGGIATLLTGGAAAPLLIGGALLGGGLYGPVKGGLGGAPPPTGAFDPNLSGRRAEQQDPLRRVLVDVIAALEGLQAGMLRPPSPVQRPEMDAPGYQPWGVAGLAQPGGRDRGLALRTTESSALSTLFGFSEEEFTEEVDVVQEKLFSFTEQWLGDQQTVQEMAAAGWSGYYNSLFQMSSKWRKMEDVNMTAVGKAMKIGAAEAGRVWAEEQAAKAMTKAKMEAAEALGAFASGNIAGGLGHLAAAAAWGGVSTFATIGSGMISGAAAGGQDMGGTSTAPGAPGPAQTVSRTAGITTQAVNVNVYIIHNDAAIYGADGLEDLTRSQILPALDEALTIGAVG